MADDKAQAFVEIERRAMAARLTIKELLEAASVPRNTYRRVKNGASKRRPDFWVTTVRKLETKLDEIESGGAVGSSAGTNGTRPSN